MPHLVGLLGRPSQTFPDKMIMLAAVRTGKREHALHVGAFGFACDPARAECVARRSRSQQLAFPRLQAASGKHGHGSFPFPAPDQQRERIVFVHYRVVRRPPSPYLAPGTTLQQEGTTVGKHFGSQAGFPHLRYGFKLAQRFYSLKRGSQSVASVGAGVHDAGLKSGYVFSHAKGTRHERRGYDSPSYPASLPQEDSTQPVRALEDPEQVADVGRSSARWRTVENKNRYF